ncbi:hypothetical protein SALBM217S_08505 [Streptomyces griseoloalbus]
MAEGAGPQGGEPPEDLTAAEAGMWQAFRNGSVYDLSSGDALVDDPHGGHPWGPERTVRARVVCWLLLDGPPALAGRVPSLKLVGVRISGPLDLAGGTVVPYVEMRGCRFERDVLLPESRFTTMRLVDCSIPRLEAARLHTEGDLHLPRCRFLGGIRLTDARIGTDLLLNQAVVHRDRSGRSIAGDGMSVGQDLQAEMLESYGELSLRGATIGVSLSLRGARLVNPHGRLALNAPQLTVERSLYLTPAGVGAQARSGMTPARGTRIQRFDCEGGIRLDDGRFGDAVDFEGAVFTFTDEQELSLRRVQTPELRFLGQRPARGRVVLSGARVVNLMDRADSWPGPGRLHMGGFAYENLVPRGPFPLALRLRWRGGPCTRRSSAGWRWRCRTSGRAAVLRCWGGGSSGVRAGGAAGPASTGGGARAGALLRCAAARWGGSCAGAGMAVGGVHPGWACGLATTVAAGATGSLRRS